MNRSCRYQAWLRFASSKEVGSTVAAMSAKLKGKLAAIALVRTLAKVWDQFWEPC
jgi:hypothetical protein